ncbi:MAG TPA: carbohydrate ABC transporter permease, partial [Spirochaetia bacterium]|nr:carbohydrate ABC transporter permease [Spirochaetia bacterium]
MNTVVNSKTRAIKIALLLLVLTFFAAIWLYPYFILVITSLKGREDLFKYSILSLPKRIVLANFSKAFTEAGLGLFIRNSVLISVVKVPAGIFIASLAAYAISKHRFRGRRFLYFFFVVGLAIPIQVTLLPLDILLKNLHLLNSIAALFFPYIAFGLPIQILVMRGYFQTVP